MSRLITAIDRFEAALRSRSPEIDDAERRLLDAIVELGPIEEYEGGSDVAPGCTAGVSHMGSIYAVGFTEDGRPLAFDLSCIRHLEVAIRRFRDTKLLLVDPISQYLPTGTDDHKSVQLRAVIGPLVKLAERLDIAVVFIHHLTKGNGTKGLYRVSGSGAYTQVCRSNWLVCKDPKDKTRRLFLSLGTNLVEEPSGLAYRIDREAGRVIWDDAPVLMTADDALRDERDVAQGERKENPSKVEQAEAWLTTLFEAAESLPSDEILTQGEVKGFKRDCLFAAKKRMNVRASKSREHNGAWLWHRPEHFDSSTLRQFDPDDGDSEVF
jgi:hypothetical protein